MPLLGAYVLSLFLTCFSMDVMNHPIQFRWSLLAPTRIELDQAQAQTKLGPIKVFYHEGVRGCDVFVLRVGSFDARCT